MFQSTSCSLSFYVSLCAFFAPLGGQVACYRDSVVVDLKTEAENAPKLGQLGKQVFGV